METGRTGFGGGNAQTQTLRLRDHVQDRLDNILGLSTCKAIAFTANCPDCHDGDVIPG